jgi:nucleoside-diphosphate-sugar epimerase
MRVLVTGSSGFLLSNILPIYDNWEIIHYKPGNEYRDIQLILHFASPSDSYDFKDKIKMATSMVDLTQSMIRIAVTNKCKLIFASSLAADVLQDDYGIYKRAMEQYIQAVLTDYLILKIPRVYGRGRTKGLMKKIALNHIDDWSKTIEYININDFVLWFTRILNNTGIEYYSGDIQCHNIKQIKELFCEF